MHSMWHLKEKLFILNTVLERKDLMLTFLNRRLMIESHKSTFTRTNPDAADFNINRPINQIYMHTIKWTEKQTKNIN